MPNRLQLPRSAPEAQGISSNAVLAFVEELERVPEPHSFMLLRHGTVVAEAWWAPYAPDLKHELFSLSKSFTSTAIGFAVAEGLISVDDQVLSFFPEQAPAEADANLQAMRIHHLLSMSTGHHDDASGRTFPNRDWVKAFLALPVEHEPGTHFVYNTAATYMLSAIIQKVTGKKLIDYLKPRLFDPLGITGAEWGTCPKGINLGGFGLSVKTEDIARFGQLYLQKGVWNGQRLLSEAWVEAASSKQVNNGDDPESDWNQGYGYQFWRCRHNFYRGDGAFGQFCIVMPEYDAVLAITSGVGDMQAVMNAAWNCLLPAMDNQALPANPEAHQVLRNTLEKLSYIPPAGEETSPLAERYSERKITIKRNPLKVSALTFVFGPDSTSMTVRTRRRDFVIELGQGVWRYGKSALLGERRNNLMAASGVWTAPDTYQATLRFYETPFFNTITAHFGEGGEVTVESKMNVGFGPTEAPPMKGRLS
jgi:CubicO group peptidase (beta-lactamase class C family)